MSKGWPAAAAVETQPSVVASGLVRWKQHGQRAEDTGHLRTFSATCTAEHLDSRGHALRQVAVVERRRQLICDGLPAAEKVDPAGGGDGDHGRARR